MYVDNDNPYPNPEDILFINISVVTFLQFSFDTLSQIMLNHNQAFKG